MTATDNMVVAEAERRRVADRRSRLHLATPNERRGKSFDELTTHESSRLEQLLVEVQSAAQYAQVADEEAISAAQRLTDALRVARAANTAASRAAFLAAGIITGVLS